MNLPQEVVAGMPWEANGLTLDGSKCRFAVKPFAPNHRLLFVLVFFYEFL
jgi:hypothetical protein